MNQRLDILLSFEFSGDGKQRTTVKTSMQITKDQLAGLLEAVLALTRTGKSDGEIKPGGSSSLQ